MANACDHSTTRLACIDCSAPVCPKCLVECAVGNRCGPCSGRFESHILKIPLLVKFKIGIVSAASGLIIMWINTDGYGGFFSWFILFGIGYGLGLLIHRTSEYKYGPKVAPIAIIGAMLGMALNTNVSIALYCVATGHASAGYFFTSLFLGAAIGIAGILVPILNSLRTR